MTTPDPARPPRANAAQVLAVVGVAASVLVAVLVWAPVGVGVLALALVVLGIGRAVGRPERSFVVRSRGFDAALLLGFGLGLGYLAIMLAVVEVAAR